MTSAPFNDACIWMCDPDVRDTLRRATVQWNRAEGAIKLAERLRGEVVIPSINELRYAGRRLVDAMSLAVGTMPSDDTEIITIKGNILAFTREMEHNCLRAQHDAVDAAILFIHRRIDKILDEFGAALVVHFFPDFVKLRSDMRIVDQFMVSSREERHKRSDYYGNLIDIYLPKVITLYDSMVSSEDLLKGHMEDVQKKGRLRKIWTISGWAIAFIVGLIGALPTLTSWLSESGKVTAEPPARSLSQAPTEKVTPALR